MPSLDVLATASEDCIIKLWAVDSFPEVVHQLETDGWTGEPPPFFEPYINLRGHTGPIFTLTASPVEDCLMFSAGREGVIKVWSIPNYKDITQYGDTKNGRNYCIGSFTDQQHETIWQVQHHPHDPLILAVYADGQTMVWEYSATGRLDAEDTTVNGKVAQKFQLASGG